MSLIKNIQKNILFKFFSSVKLAIPLMFTIAAAVSYGTIVESTYNADYAKIAVYNSWWFHGLLYLLGLNIFIAMLSRFPWKKHHLGFVITHIGMTTLLIGSWITYKHGIDGSMQVREGSSSAKVFLSEKIVEFSSNQSFKKSIFPSSISKLGRGELDKVNEKLNAPFKIVEFVPFIDLESYLANQFSPGVKIDLGLKSQFFDQNISLHTVDKNQLSLGPALLKIVSEEEYNSKDTKTEVKKSVVAAAKDHIKIFDTKENKLIAEIDIAKLINNSKTINGVKIELVQTFTRAAVEGKKITNNGSKENPAVEINLKSNNKSMREVLFSRFPSFSINTEPTFGLKFEYISSAAVQNPIPKEVKSQNIVQIAILDKDSKKIGLKLIKNDKTVLKKEVKEFETVQTPWMGMEISLKGLNELVETEDKIIPIAAPKKSDNLPPGAIQIEYNGDERDWVIEGQVKSFFINDKPLNVYFGKNQISLPFQIQLEDFHKKTYPGTDNAISFESDVLINGIGNLIKISMNEPLKHAGFTVYQASYITEPNQPAISVFSINKDPGRFWKYLGSLIMSAGIIIYTLMKSSYYRKWSAK